MISSSRQQQKSQQQQQRLQNTIRDPDVIGVIFMVHGGLSGDGVMQNRFYYVTTSRRRVGLVHRWGGVLIGSITHKNSLHIKQHDQDQTSRLHEENTSVPCMNVCLEPLPVWRNWTTRLFRPTRNPCLNRLIVVSFDVQDIFTVWPTEIDRRAVDPVTPSLWTGRVSLRGRTRLLSGKILYNTSLWSEHQQYWKCHLWTFYINIMYDTSWLWIAVY